MIVISLFIQSVIFGAVTNRVHAQLTPSVAVDQIYYQKQESARTCIKGPANPTTAQTAAVYKSNPILSAACTATSNSIDETYTLKPYPPGHEREFIGSDGDKSYDRVDTTSEKTIHHWYKEFPLTSNGKSGGWYTDSILSPTGHSVDYPPSIPINFAHGSISYSFGTTYHTDEVKSEDSRAQAMFAINTAGDTNTYRVIFTASANKVYLNQKTNAFEYPPIKCSELKVGGVQVNNSCQVSFNFTGPIAYRDVTVTAPYNYYQYNVYISSSPEKISTTPPPPSQKQNFQLSPYDYSANIFESIFNWFTR